MSAQPAVGARAALAGMLGAAADWLVEPAEQAGGEAEAPDAVREHPVIAVVGLSGGCGATTIARALGVELAARDPGGACAVTADGVGAALPLGVPAAGRLTRALAPVAPGARSCGRLCLVPSADRAALAGAVLYLAPLVLDVDDARDAAAAASVADRVVLLAGPSTQPALAAVLAESLTRVGPEPLIVRNRADADTAGSWSARVAAELPESRVAARLALAGREPRGEFGRSVSVLADALEGAG